jgi:hypothetical protein
MESRRVHIGYPRYTAIRRHYGVPKKIDGVIVQPGAPYSATSVGFAPPVFLLFITDTRFIDGVP